MMCAWQALINLLPPWMRESVDMLGSKHLQEIRLRLNSPPVLILNTGQKILKKNISSEDISFVVNLASQYSPWTSESIAQFYITAPGGHRIGLCGNAVSKNGTLSSIRNLTSICIRVAKDYPGIAAKALQYSGSILIIGKPGSGKTTLLRDLIRQHSTVLGTCISVVDERQEIFPIAGNSFCFPPGPNTDVLSGCKKNNGIEATLRTMGPDIIAMDEITATEDCAALIHAAWCGVKLFATAHAGSINDLHHRPVYRSIIESEIFDVLFIMRPDKSWCVERIKQ